MRNKTIFEEGIEKLAEEYERVTGVPQGFTLLVVDCDTDKSQVALISNLERPVAVELLEESVRRLKEPT